MPAKLLARCGMPSLTFCTADSGVSTFKRSYLPFPHSLPYRRVGEGVGLTHSRRGLHKKRVFSRMRGFELRRTKRGAIGSAVQHVEETELKKRDKQWIIPYWDVQG